MRHAVTALMVGLMRHLLLTQLLREPGIAFNQRCRNGSIIDKQYERLASSGGGIRGANRSSDY